MGWMEFGIFIAFAAVMAAGLLLFRSVLEKNSRRIDELEKERLGIQQQLEQERIRVRQELDAEKLRSEQAIEEEKLRCAQAVEEERIRCEHALEKEKLHSEQKKTLTDIIQCFSVSGIYHMLTDGIADHRDSLGSEFHAARDRVEMAHMKLELQIGSAERSFPECGKVEADHAWEEATTSIREHFCEMEDHYLRFLDLGEQYLGYAREQTENERLTDLRIQICNNTKKILKMEKNNSCSRGELKSIQSEIAKVNQEITQLSREKEAGTERERIRLQLEEERSYLSHQAWPAFIGACSNYLACRAMIGGSNERPVLSDEIGTEL